MLEFPYMRLPGGILRPIVAVAIKGPAGVRLVDGLLDTGSDGTIFLRGCDSVGSRILMAYVVGFLLSLGPFDHAIVTLLHVFIGMVAGVSVSPRILAAILEVVTAGNVIGGVGVVPLSHVAQAKGADE